MLAVIHVNDFEELLVVCLGQTRYLQLHHTINELPWVDSAIFIRVQHLMQKFHCVIAILQVVRDLVELRPRDLVQIAKVWFLRRNLTPKFVDLWLLLLLIGAAAILIVPLIFELLDLVE